MDFWAENLLSNRVHKSFESKKDRNKPKQYKFEEKNNNKNAVENIQSYELGYIEDRRIGEDRRQSDTGVAERFDPRNKRDRRKYAKISCKI